LQSSLAVSKGGRRFTNGIIPQGLTRLDWYGDSYPAFSDKPHLPLRRLDFDPTIPADDAQGHSRFQPGLVANCSWQHQPAGGVHG